jgi:hypothetical protein
MLEGIKVLKQLATYAIGDDQMLLRSFIQDWPLSLRLG